MSWQLAAIFPLHQRPHPRSPRRHGGKGSDPCDEAALHVLLSAEAIRHAEVGKYRSLRWNSDCLGDVG